MSTSTPRIKRGQAPKNITKSNYRKRSLPALRRDFKDRCAYSDLHMDFAGGLACMDVDHFNPKLKKRPKQSYSNLFLSSRHCNGAKNDYWPSAEDRKLGLRLLNPCKETEFPEHIVENPQTGKLEGKTPAGKWHIRIFGLNEDFLVRHRLQRRKFRELLNPNDHFVLLKKEVCLKAAGEKLTELVEHIDKMIMDIPESE